MITSYELPADLPRNPSDVQVEPVLRDLSEKVGFTVSAAKISGYWLIYDDREGTEKLRTGRPEIGLPNYRSLDKALSNALQIAIVSTISLR